MAPFATGDDSLEQFEGHPVLDEDGPRDRYSPLLVAGAGIAAVVDAFRVGIGSIASPGPGLWPFIVGASLLLFAPAIAIVGHRFSLVGRDGLRRIGLIVAGLVLFVLLYDWVGFIVAGFVTLMFVTRGAAREGWRASILTSLIAPVAVYVVFALLLGVSLRVL